MSMTKFNKKDFKKFVSKDILQRTKENMEIYHLNLNDAFKEACCELAKKGTDVWKAWYYDDFREYIPCVYIKEYLDFEKYPLRY